MICFAVTLKPSGNIGKKITVSISPNQRTRTFVAYPVTKSTRLLLREAGADQRENLKMFSIKQKSEGHFRGLEVSISESEASKSVSHT